MPHSSRARAALRLLHSFIQWICACAVHNKELFNPTPPDLDRAALRLLHSFIQWICACAIHNKELFNPTPPELDRAALRFLHPLYSGSAHAQYTKNIIIQYSLVMGDIKILKRYDNYRY